MRCARAARRCAWHVRVLRGRRRRWASQTCSSRLEEVRVGASTAASGLEGPPMPRISDRSTCAWLERRIGALSLSARMRPSSAASCALRRQVDLVEDDAVGDDDLVDRLVVVAGQRRIVEVRAAMCSASTSVTTPSSLTLLRDLVVDEEGGGHRRRDRPGRWSRPGCGRTCRCRSSSFCRMRTRSVRTSTDAADAAVGHLEDLFVGRQHEVGVDVDLAELVLDHRDAVAVALGQDVVEQRRLAGAEEAGEDRDGHRAARCGSCVMRDSFFVRGRRRPASRAAPAAPARA